MLINILSREACIDAMSVLDFPTLVISIHTPECDTQRGIPTAETNLVHVEFFEFHDIDRPQDGCVLMNESDAERIKSVVDKYKDSVKQILVHCDAGISRSAGIGAAIALYLNGDDKWVWNSWMYYPNRLCYSLMLKAFFGDETTLKDVWENPDPITEDGWVTVRNET